MQTSEMLSLNALFQDSFPCYGRRGTHRDYLDGHRPAIRRDGSCWFFVYSFVDRCYNL